MKQRHVVIVGGGASGIVAAISAARNGAKVTLLEQKDRIGKKILSTGNGKCNLTNEHMNMLFFRSDNVAVVAPVLEQFNEKETLRFFEELGVLFKNRLGYIYPITEQATTILDVLRMELARLNVDVRTEVKVLELKKQEPSFCVITDKEQILADAVILATGGMAAPNLGSDGSGYKIAKSMGHHISEVVPALVALHGKGTYFKQLAGVRTKADVTLMIDGKWILSDCGEVQLTNYGISGIPVFQVSRYAAKALSRNKQVVAELDLLPSMAEDEFEEYMYERKRAQKNKNAEEFLIGIFHKKIIGVLLKQANIPATKTMNSVNEKQFQKLLDLCKHFQIEIIGTNSFEQAQVCAGGVKTKEINPHTMQSIYHDELYLTGELLDVDGICGGYNLQWAWSTGYIAGLHAAKGK